MLEINKLTKRFGTMAALNSCSLNVNRNSITGVIGPNGSGKSTLFNCISGVLKPSEGSITFDQNGSKHTLENLLPYRIARLGIGRTFQLNRVFKRMSALDNLLVVNFDLERAHELLKTARLDQLSDHMAGELSIGQQRLLEIARAFMLDPDLVLLDEPTAGVNPKMIGTLVEQIERFKEKENATFLIVEHNLKFIFNLSNQIYVLNAGEVIADGTPDEIRNNEIVIDAYLGRHRAES